MRNGRVRRRWSATFVGSLAALALAAGCTGDEGVQVVTDDVDGAAALADAIDETPDFGRFRFEWTMDMPDPSGEADDWSMHTAADGEFVGEDARYNVTMVVDGEELDRRGARRGRT